MRLEVRRQSDLAVRALKLLAGREERLRALQLAEALETTAGFVAQVMNPLVRAGWVTSEPGPSGGYRLDVDGHAISVLDVIEAVEGPTDSGRCVLVDRPCHEQGSCALHTAWTRARTRLLEDLGATTVADAPEPAGRASR